MIILLSIWLDWGVFYFLHSYYFSCNNIDDEIAASEYGIKFTCAVNHENIYGVQFHPEVSGNQGTQLIQNFIEICVNYSKSNTVN